MMQASWTQDPRRHSGGVHDHDRTGGQQTRGSGGERGSGGWGQWGLCHPSNDAWSALEPWGPCQGGGIRIQHNSIHQPSWEVYYKTFFLIKFNVKIPRQEYLEELEKWSSPPSYSEVVTIDPSSTVGTQGIEEGPDKSDNDDNDEASHQVTIDMHLLTAEAGLPSYDEACRINNINNNYI